MSLGGSAGQVLNTARSTPIGRLSVQPYKQILPVYLTNSLVVSPKTFRNNIVSLQNCHRPCSEMKSSLFGLVRWRPEFGAVEASHFLDSYFCTNRVRVLTVFEIGFGLL